MTFVIVNGKQFYYTRPGRAAGGPGVMLLHGAGGSHLDWPREIQRLPGCNVFNIDLPGHGRSEGGGHNEIEAYAADVDALAQSLEIENICVVGHSMGGAIALSLALMGVPWLSAIVLIGSGAELPVSPRILQALQDDTEEAVGNIMRYAFPGDATPDLLALTSAAMLSSGANQLLQSFSACSVFDVRDRLGEVKVPALVMCGNEDRMTPLALSRELAAGLPDARLAILNGAGHYATLEKPGIVARELSAFLRGRSCGTQDIA